MASTRKLALQLIVAGCSVLHEAIEPSTERGSMARKRYQKGYVYLDGQNWKGRYREDVITAQGVMRVRREAILGAKREMTKHLAERQMEIVLARINCLDYRPGRAATFGEFIERWKTEVLTNTKAILCASGRSHLKCYIIPGVGKLRLDQFGVENQQRFITRMPERSTTRLSPGRQCLNVIATISTILTTARNWGYNCEQID